MVVLKHVSKRELNLLSHVYPRCECTRIAKLMGPIWGPPQAGSCRPQMGPMLAPRTLLSGYICSSQSLAFLCICIKQFSSHVNVHGYVLLCAHGMYMECTWITSRNTLIHKYVGSRPTHKQNLSGYS